METTEMSNGSKVRILEGECEGMSGKITQGMECMREQWYYVDLDDGDTWTLEREENLKSI